MKRYMYVFLIIVTLVVTACGVVKKDNNINVTNKISGSINGEKIELTYDSNFKDLYYKENVSLFTSNSMGALKILQYRKDGNTLLEIRMGYIEGMTLERTKKESKYETSIKKINDLDYLYSSFILTDSTGSEYKTHQYYYEYNNVTYTIMFVSNEDISSLEETFMSNVYFKNN